MIEVSNNLLVGDDIDCRIVLTSPKNIDASEWAIVHAAKEKWHRDALGYTGRGAPKDSPEYLVARRNNELMLNIVDANNSLFFSKEMIDAALAFIEEKLGEGLNVLVHCNQGESRSPSIAMLYLIKKGIVKGDTLEDCEVEFLKVYPKYNPGTGIRGFVKEHWGEYVNNL